MSKIEVNYEADTYELADVFGINEIPHTPNINTQDVIPVVGTLMWDTTTYKLYASNGFQWILISATGISGGGSSGDLWRYFTDAATSHNTVQLNPLHVPYSGSGDFVYPNTGTNFSQGSVRMFFDVTQRAFRAGYTTSTQWDLTSRGTGSVAFGADTIAPGLFSTISGGLGNKIVQQSDPSEPPTALYATISGGQSGTIASGGNYCFIGGGQNNEIRLGIFSPPDDMATSTYSCIVGGLGHRTFAGSDYSFIGGGSEHTLLGTGSFIGGGFIHETNAQLCSIVGGLNNNTTATGGFVGGGSFNSTNGEYGSIMGGSFNSSTGNFSTIGGGTLNYVAGLAGFIGGGLGNIIQLQTDVSQPDIAVYATICGGYSGTIASGGHYSFIGGGQNNEVQLGIFNPVDEEFATSTFATIGGGFGNVISPGSDYAFIGGGSENQALGTGCFSGGGMRNECFGEVGVVCGGFNNFMSQTGSFVGAGSFNGANGDHSICVGGNNNGASGNFSIVVGGAHNQTRGSFDFIGGGENNDCEGFPAALYGTICGGFTNHIATNADYATIGGGRNNYGGGTASFIGGGFGNTAGGQYASIAGGRSNRANGYYSFAGGLLSNASHTGCFIYSDEFGGGSNPSTASNQLTLAFAGGSIIYSDSARSTGVTLASGGGSWASVSDINKKENLHLYDTRDALTKIDELPIYSYNYKGTPTDVINIGPVSQDWHALFPSSKNNLVIETMDMNGVAFACIKELNKQIKELRNEIQTLKNFIKIQN